MDSKKRWGERIRGWLPKEPTLLSPKKTKIAEVKITPMMEGKRKAFKIASIANAITLSTFLGTHFLIDPYNRSTEVTIISWSAFLLSLTSVNFFLYNRSKKQARHIEE
jgi:hypothetical protein